MSSASLDDWLSHISAIHPNEIELGLERVKDVWAHLGEPALAKYTVIVAGTNGKGSTAFMLARLLMTSGYHVGVYSSPHISSYNERVQVDGKPLSDEEIAAGFSVVEQARQDIALTYFEFGTLAAFSALALHKLDVAILEVGLGGRLDAVNIIDADVAIVTSVALDHVDWLGDDLDQIGYEKAGVLRTSGIALLGEDLPDTVAAHARDIECATLTYGGEFTVAEGVFHGCDIANVVPAGSRALQDCEALKAKGSSESAAVRWRMPVSHLPDNNIALAAQAYLLLDRGLTPNRAEVPDASALTCALEDFSISGRMERLANYPNLFVDVCHNPHAAAHMSSVLEGYRERVIVVFTALDDKDIEGVVKVMAPFVDRWLIAPLSVPRAATVARLESAVGQYARDMLSFPDLNAAMNESRQYLTGENVVLVFGSFFAVEAAKAFYSE